MASAFRKFMSLVPFHVDLRISSSILGQSSLKCQQCGIAWKVWRVGERMEWPVCILWKHIRFSFSVLVLKDSRGLRDGCI